MIWRIPPPFCECQLTLFVGLYIAHLVYSKLYLSKMPMVSRTDMLNGQISPMSNRDHSVLVDWMNKLRIILFFVFREYWYNLWQMFHSRNLTNITQHDTWQTVRNNAIHKKCLWVSLSNGGVYFCPDHYPDLVVRASVKTCRLSGQ